MATKFLHNCSTTAVSFDISTFYLEISTFYLEISTFYFVYFLIWVMKTLPCQKWNSDNMDATMKRPFDLRLTQHEIWIVLSRRFYCSISVRQLRHVLARLQLYMYRQRKYFTDFDEVCDFVRNHLAISGHVHWYRFMHLKYITNGLVVNKEKVRIFKH